MVVQVETYLTFKLSIPKLEDDWSPLLTLELLSHENTKKILTLAVGLNINAENCLVTNMFRL
jgi:hypothetical protein